jgi:hypothetical protein
MLHICAKVFTGQGIIYRTKLCTGQSYVRDKVMGQT